MLKSMDFLVCGALSVQYSHRFRTMFVAVPHSLDDCKVTARVELNRGCVVCEAQSTPRLPLGIAGARARRLVC